MYVAICSHNSGLVVSHNTCSIGGLEPVGGVWCLVRLYGINDCGPKTLQLLNRLTFVLWLF